MQLLFLVVYSCIALPMARSINPTSQVHDLNLKAKAGAAVQGIQNLNLKAKAGAVVKRVRAYFKPSEISAQEKVANVKRVNRVLQIYELNRDRFNKYLLNAKIQQIKLQQKLTDVDKAKELITEDELKSIQMTPTKLGLAGAGVGIAAGINWLSRDVNPIPNAPRDAWDLEQHTVHNVEKQTLESAESKPLESAERVNPNPTQSAQSKPPQSAQSQQSNKLLRPVDKQNQGNGFAA
jgi:hypothetical protein